MISFFIPIRKGSKRIKKKHKKTRKLQTWFNRIKNKAT